MLISKKILEPKIKKIVFLSSVLFLLVMLFIVFGAAWSSNSVNIYDEDNVLNVKTKKTIVEDVLKEAGVFLLDFDRVEPDLKSPVKNNMDVVIKRASKVTIIDDDIPVEYYSTADDVEGVLNQTGYTLSENDAIYPPPSEKVTEGMVIEILRAKTVCLYDDKDDAAEPIFINTSAKTVGDFISEQGISLSDGDDVNLENFVKLKNNMKIKISRVKVKYEEVTDTIAYKNITREKGELEKGKTRVVQEGRNGQRLIKYQVMYRNGQEIARSTVSNTVIKSPVNRITEVGTFDPNSVPKKDFSYSRMISCVATAYDLSYESCGKRPGDPYYGITASGMKAQYGVVAVDTRVIPFGTRLYVEAPDGSWVYGYCVAGDTGSSIKGNRIDLFFNSRNEALSFGRRKANVYILN